MLRSLVAPSKLSPSDDVLIRRNLLPDALRETVNNGDVMWIDLVDPSKKEIDWLEQAFNLHPMVVSDLNREDRRPTLLIYPNYLFLSLFQADIHQDQVQSLEVHCIVGERFYVTVRRTGSAAVDSAYEVAAQNIAYW